MKKILYFFIAIFILQSTNLMAHSGGHYHKEDGKVLNSWRLKSGELVKGNFSFAKDDRIFLEQEGGLIKPIYINDLSIQDQKLAKFKIIKLLQINDAYFNNDKDTNNHTLKYLPLFIFSLLLWIVYSFNKELIRVYIFNSRLGFTAMSVLFIFSILMACSKSTTTNSDTPIVTPTVNPITVTIPKTSSAFMDSAFAAFKPSIGTSWDDTYFYIASTGIPSHNMMIGITNWQQQVPITQPYNGTNSWSIPLQPAYATIPLSTKTNLMKGAVAVAVNGIPIFNALNNRGEDSYKIGELDNWGGHCGKGDDYHYHAAPMHLSSLNGLKPIAFAVDGFPVYGLKEPDGASMIALDTCHGHNGTNGLYHYHGTTDYPYVIGALKGKITLDPNTTAPENQVIPQAFTKPVRPATSPLSGAAITDFVAVGTNGYLLTYKRGTKNGYVKYSWDANNKYTFILTDTSG
ncbi:MAG: YHYH protein, partial [Chitinophagaceae bacterium]|nr:YHYH protein [Chitinophagaceae bacterium]